VKGFKKTNVKNYMREKNST